VGLLEGSRFVLVVVGVLLVIVEVADPVGLLVSDEDAERPGNPLGFVGSTDRLGVKEDVSDRVAEIEIVAVFELVSEMVGV